MSDEAPTIEEKKKPSSARLLVALGVVAAVIAALVLGEHTTHADDPAPVADASRATRVITAQARVAPAEVELRLPGSTRASDEATVRARATGYVARLTVDLGDGVHAGQVLAEIRAPETADELHAAEARVAQAAEQASWASQSVDRTRALAGRGIATSQELDDAALALASAEAARRVAEADTDRLRSVRRYQTVTAPFDGIVVERLVDPGSLVTAGTDGLFRVAAAGQLEVVVDVPQIYAALVHVGQPVRVARPDAAGAIIEGTITRVAGELDATTRTMRIEASLPPSDGLLGGMFVDARITVQRPAPPVVVPARALQVIATGLRVWTLDDGVVHAHVVTIARDLGRELELSEGLHGGETIVLSAPDGLTEGDAVEAVERETP